MLTVSKLARECGLSRSTVLYYESIGLLRPPLRTGSNYRRYGEKESARLRQICVYRNAGLRLADIQQILDRPDSGAAAILKRRLEELDGEIEALRTHQQAILKLLRARTSLRRQKVITKEKWVSIMQAAGFAEPDMRRWHVEFEKQAPEEHQEFLQFLNIPPNEITAIREWSRAGTGA
jgi:MerR family transcriptional regulator, thiopeptide resistance regulator